MSVQKTFTLILGLAALLLWAAPAAADVDCWDKSSIMLDGKCLADGQAEFSVTNTGAAMAGPSAWREYEDGSLAQNGEFTLAAGATQTWKFVSNGTEVRFEADQRPGHPGHSAPKLTLTCDRPTAVTLTTFAATSTQLLATICQKGIVVDFLDAPGGHVVYVVREGHTFSDAYWTTRHFSVTQRVRICAGIVN